MPGSHNTPLPAALSGEIVERLIRVDKSLLPYIAGALEYATDREPYDQTGTLTVDQAREVFGQMIWDFYHEKVSSAVIGQIAYFGLSAAPDGWLACDGAYVPIASYPALFDAIGENFGFSVGGNFVLPDLRFRASVGVGELDYDPAFEIGLGERVGNMEIAITTPNLPAHNHSLSRITGSGAQTGYNAVTGASFIAITQTTGNTGAGAPFPLLQPVIGLLACIYAGE